MIKVGDVEAKKGTIQKGFFRVGSYSDASPISLPIMIASGKQDGPTLWLQAAVHGEEFGGSASIINLVNSLDLETLKGTIVAVPVVNLPSYRAKSRTSSLDGENLNRIFPGSLNGTYSHQLAHVIVEEITKTANYFIDLHSGGIGAEVPFYAIYVDDQSKAAIESKRLCKHIGVEFIWKIKGEAGLLGAVVAQIVNKGIPSLTIEVGGGNITEQHIHEYVSSMENVMKAIGMIDGNAPILDQYTIIEDGNFLFNHEGGLFIPKCKVGDVLNKGELIGQITNLFGEVVEDIVNPSDNAYIAAIRLAYWPCDSGDLVAESIVIEKSESFKE
ncbi:succinylglutamate desuccinylase/aspartoacylase family protein (plasmid) [Cytobacillus oceanisediminis]|uniref:succinylglutamate desuccinylase/aspartoacylase family protein n=1 Tax=Cytobacillus oceanisediminis TaxID=665099 RepID=UPI001864474D|nr:M14 family metallopeptidase [Cytobacillus oceanisediminis]QOK29895.1 succinylglutamate desuccinylase/aspartoacylase family protein [Cytobacillus oceanisediminis]